MVVVVVAVAVVVAVGVGVGVGVAVAMTQAANRQRLRETRHQFAGPPPVRSEDVGRVQGRCRS